MNDDARASFATITRWPWCGLHFQGAPRPCLPDTYFNQLREIKCSNMDKHRSLRAVEKFEPSQPTVDRLSIQDVPPLGNRSRKIISSREN